ncbi:MAG: hypothetical protein HYZ28_12640 [Myxococcales bacterium]|nr:hypothetical protein [Myxococcales bacterium]
MFQRSRQRVRAAAAAVLLASCAHAPPPPPPPPDAPAWPPPPEIARIRFEGTFPDARIAPEKPSIWQRALEVILGIDPAEARREGLYLHRPFGIAASDRGFVLTDPDGRAVLKVDWLAAKAVPVVCADHPWEMPMAVALGPSGELYVADGGAGAVVRVEPGGACSLIGTGALERPTGLAFSSGSLFVVDPPRHQVVAFGPDGRERIRFGARGDSGSGLNFPTAIAASTDGTLLVVDALNFRVARFSAQGEFLGAFGTAGDGGGAFGRPKAIAMDAGGKAYISDAHHDVVIIFSPAGDFELAVGGSGAGAGTFTLPAGVAIGGDFLYVVDSYNHRVEVFRILGGGKP